MSFFVVGLTNDDPRTTPPVFKQYDYVQYNDRLPILATAAMSFPTSDETFRYVIVQRQYEDRNWAICLGEVRVFVRGKNGYDMLVVRTAV